MIELGTDIAKILRKQSKLDKYEHGNGRARKEQGESYQKSKVVNSSQPSSYTSSNAPIGQFPQGNDTRGLKKTHGEKEICTKRSTKEAQGVTITDCHAGNPCELNLIQQTTMEIQSLEGMKSQD
ncbi:hypothetical protein Tco_1152506 [Tanacetum coccineum]